MSGTWSRSAITDGTSSIPGSWHLVRLHSVNMSRPRERNSRSPRGSTSRRESGWFSDRTVRYLASGKPALVQDTGFSRNYPTGEGLVAFRTMDEAVTGAERIARDYVEHGRAARAIAEAYFDSDRVLGQLLEETGLVA